jgi:secreted trypsin-like serine protease
MRRTAVVVATGIAAVAISGGPAQAIARGQDAGDGRYPFSAELVMTGIPAAGGGTRDSSCSGSLVAPHWIITAGHCFKDAAGRHVDHPVAARTVAVVGRADLAGSDGTEATVVAVRQSPTHDIALARLDRAVTAVAPVRLATAAPRTGARVRLTGYGLTGSDDGTLPERMQTGEFRVGAVTATRIGMSGIAPHADTSPCEHDSGGPYFTGTGPATLVAVVSRGPACPHTGADTAARVDTARSWILSVIGADLTARVTPPSTAPPPASALAPPASALAPPAAALAAPPAERFTPEPAAVDRRWPGMAGAAGLAGALVLLPLVLRRRKGPAPAGMHRPAAVRSHRRR